MACFDALKEPYDHAFEGAFSMGQKLGRCAAQFALCGLAGVARSSAFQQTVHRLGIIAQLALGGGVGRLVGLLCLARGPGGL
jgi:ABC-type uncharacterized transport system permease subunit